MLPCNCEKKKKRSTLRHNIYTVALFSECTSKREGKEVCALIHRGKTKGGERDMWPADAWLHVAPNQNRVLSGSAHFPSQVRLSVPP